MENAAFHATYIYIQLIFQRLTIFESCINVFMTDFIYPVWERIWMLYGMF